MSMEKIKRSVSAILSVLMAASVFTTTPVSAATVEASVTDVDTAFTEQAELKIAEGSCGEKLTWSLSSDGVLEISGEGKMYDFELEANEDENSFNPWTLYRNQIKKIVVNDGVEYIGNFAFFGCTELEDAEMPENIILGENVFEGCNKYITEAPSTEEVTEAATEEETTEAVVEETTKAVAPIAKEEEEAVGAGTASVANCSVRLSVGSYLYDGTAKKPSAYVYYGSTRLVKNTDFTISYKNNVNAGTATATITGKGNYYGTKSVNFVISNTTKDFTKCSVTLLKDSVEYDDSYQQPGVTVKDGTKTLVNNSDYIVTYSNCVFAGTAKAIVIGKGIYSGKVEKTFTITKRSISNITFTANEAVYNGKQRCPGGIVKDGNRILTPGVDYYFLATNNINAGTAQLAIVGMGNYKDQSQQTFNILPKSLDNCDITLDQDTFEYDGTEKHINFTVKDGSKTLAINEDFSIGHGKLIAPGVKYIYFYGKGNYSGTVKKPIIIKKPLSDCEITLDQDTFEYDGTEKHVNFTVKDGSKTLAINEDFSVGSGKLIAPGVHYIHFYGLGDYMGEVKKAIVIQKPLSQCEITFEQDTFEYDGTEKHINFTVKDGSKTLAINEDFAVVHGKLIAPGVQYIYFYGRGNYSGTVKKPIYIQKPISNCEITFEQDTFEYDGTEKHVNFTVKDGSKALVINEDFSVGCGKLVAPGEHFIYFYGKGAYSGQTKKAIYIGGKNISECQIILEQDTFEYDGNDKNLNFTVKDGSKTLELDKDFTIGRGKMIAVGEYYLHIYGKNSYYGETTAKITITKAHIQNETVSLIVSQFGGYFDACGNTRNLIYATINNGTNTNSLTLGSGYTVEYQDNADDTVTATVFLKNYYDTFSITYTPTSNPSFIWGHDNWSFDNSGEYFTHNYSVNDEVFDKMASDFCLNDNERQSIIDKIDAANANDFRGSCNGISTGSILAKMGYLNLAELGCDDIAHSNTVDKGSSTPDNITSVLNFLQQMWTNVRYGYFQTTLSTTSQYTQAQIIQKLEEEFNNNHSVIKLGYSLPAKDPTKNDGMSHAVVAYGIEEYDYHSDITGKDYTHRILIYDPNAGSTNTVTNDKCIYFNKSDYSWVCPYWNNAKAAGIPRKCYWNSNGSASDNAYINMAQQLTSLTNTKDIISGNLWIYSQDRDQYALWKFNSAENSYSIQLLKDDCSGFIFQGTTLKIGDLNSDRHVDISDATVLQRYLNGTTTLQDFQVVLADFNRDCKVDEKDVRALQMYINN